MAKSVADEVKDILAKGDEAPQPIEPELVPEEERAAAVVPFDALKGALLGLGEQINQDATIDDLAAIAARHLAPKAFIPDTSHPSGIAAIPNSRFNWVYREKNGVYDSDGAEKHLIRVEKLTDGSFWCVPNSYLGESWRALNDTPEELSKGVPH